MQHDSSDDDNTPPAATADTEFQFPPDLARDLELMMATELRIGASPISKLSPKTARPMWVRFRQAGVIWNRAYRSASAWRVKVTYALKNNESLQVLEMDEWGRLKAMFPREVLTRLRWSAARDFDTIPVARVYDPAGPSEMLLLRSRLNGHGVDVLHNLTDGGPILQSIWVADIIRLNPLLGIKLVRDDAFNPTAPIRRECTDIIA